MKTRTQGITIPSITHWGVSSDCPPAFAKRIVLTNILGSLMAGNFALASILFAYLGHINLAAYTFVGALIELCWPLLNFFGFQNHSRLGMLVSSNLLGFGLGVLLPQSGYHQIFFVMAGVPFLLFGLHEKKSVLLGIALPLFLYPLSIGGFSFQSFLGTMVVMLIFLMFYFLTRENAHAEELLGKALTRVNSEKKKIQELNKQIEIQQARAFSSAKFAALGEMAGGVAHEINNPMTVINLKAQQLKFIVCNECHNEQAIQCVEAISKAVHRVAKIIDTMRMFSRDGGSPAFEVEPLKKIVEGCITFCGERFKNHETKLEFTFPEENIKLRCRPVQLTQVILNLINNAFDAVQGLPEKWVKVDVIKDADNKKVYVCVTDSGKGISEALHEQIFLPFFTSKPVGKGTGLGLSLARQVVHDHGGMILVDSSSMNTRFVVEFPL